MPPVRPKPLAVVLVAVGSLFFAAAAAAHEKGLRPVSPVSPNVERITDIYYLLLAVAGLVFVSVMLPLALFVVRFRHAGRDRSAEGPQIRGNTNLELAWTAVPVVLLAIIAGFVLYKLPGIQDVTQAGERELRVRVEGRRFYWQYEYPNGVIAINRLRAPADETVELEITAPDGDVNHSFWVPPLGGKFDAIPGTTTETQFRARRIGVYRGQCGEFCGIQHAAMLASVDVMPHAAFDRWLATEAREQRAGTSDLGRQLWQGVCSQCHEVDALGNRVAGQVAPPLRGNPTLARAEDVERIVREGRGAMPPVGQGWSDRQMRALTRYLANNVAGGDDDGS